MPCVTRSGAAGRLKGTTLTVDRDDAGTGAVHEAQQWLEKLKTPLRGLPMEAGPSAAAVTCWPDLSQQLGAEVIFEGPDLAAPVTEDLRGTLAD